MHRRSLAVLVCALALAVLAPAAASAAPTWAPASTAAIHPGVQTFTDGAPVHRELRLLRRDATSTSARPRTARAPVGNTETDGCTRGSLPIGTPVDVDRRQQARHAGLQLVDHDAGAGRDRRQHVPVQRPRAGQARPGRRGQGQPVDPASGAGRRASARRPRRATRSTRTATPSCAAASPSSARRRATASATTAAAGPHRLHRDAGIPGDSGSAFLDKHGHGARHPEHASRSRRSPAPTASATSPRSSPTRRPTASAA